MGDANASIPTPQPVKMRPMFAANGVAASKCSFMFVSKSSIENNISTNYGLNKPLYAIKNTRNIGKKDMKLNDSMPQINVDSETFKVTADGVLLTCEPVTKLPLAQLYFM
jgi:urease subunit alpha